MKHCTALGSFLILGTKREAQETHQTYNAFHPTKPFMQGSSHLVEF